MKTIHLECKPDETLVKVLGKTNRYIIHHNDKGRVCKYLSKNADLVGLIDEDPGSAQPSYLGGLKIVDKKYNIKELKDNGLQNKILVLCPRLEDWVVQLCKTENVDIESFNLNKNPNALHREIISKLNNFERLLFHLKERVQSKAILHLEHLLK